MSDRTAVTASPDSGLGDRLRTVRQDYGVNIDLADLSPAEFAGMLGCSCSAYESYESGLADPSAAVLLAIRQHTGVSLDWLLTGDV